MSEHQKAPVRIMCKCEAWSAGTATATEALRAHQDHLALVHDGFQRGCYIEDDSTMTRAHIARYFKVH